MIAREKAKGHILPAYMKGGIGNPLGARALYIGGGISLVHVSHETPTNGPPGFLRGDLSLIYIYPPPSRKW